MFRGECGGHLLWGAGKRVRGSNPAHGHVSRAFRGRGVKGGEMGGVTLHIGVAKY
jgi:hypothetical protein